MDSRPTIVTVLGTRPEIIKCSTLLPRFDADYEHVLIHTGQHYDEQMDAVFFRELSLRAPDVALGVGSGSHAGQLAKMLLGIEAVLIGRKPDLVFVQGDTNSTLAGGLAAAKLNVPVAHLEAGCRSFNRAMPEEVNRVVVDHLAELLLTPDELADGHLRDEGIAPERIVNVGSTAIDACLRIAAISAPNSALPGLEAGESEYLVATIHRAENTTPDRLRGLFAALADLSTRWPVVVPVHPRTARAIDGLSVPPTVRLIEPVGYATMMRLVGGCRALLTDSGGLQEEAAVLGAPTFILREETEWRAFVDAGHHQLVGTDPATIIDAVRSTLTDGEREHRMRQPIGHERAGATERVMAALDRYFMAGSLPDRTGLEGHRTWNQYTAALSNGHVAAASAGAQLPQE
jgi:UDP-N-acetylglucosamine 2-epimerase (non-hydrolysing)